MNERRWANFRANRRGYYSLWIFLFLFFLTLFSEFVANDKPILISYKGELLTPIFVSYPEEKFGGFLPVTDYRDPFVQEEIDANGWILWAPIRYSYNTINNELPEPAPARPSWQFDRETRCARYDLGVDDPNCTIGNWELARHGRSGPRRGGPHSLRVPAFGDVRTGPDLLFRADRGVGGGCTRLFRWLD